MKIRNLVLGLFVLMILVVNVSALGITPGRTTFDFVPGDSKVVVFNVINSDEAEMNLVVMVQGEDEMKEHIALSEELFTMSKDEKERSSSFVVNMPDSLSPGLHKIDVVVVQLPDNWVETSEAFVGSSLAVVTQIYVRVSYPGKYAEADLNVIGGDDEITFVIPVISRGDLDLVSVKGVIDIYTSLNEKVATVNTNEISLLTSERKELVARWDHDFPSGPYRAVATVIYDESTINLEKEFDVGESVLELQSMEVNDFSLGEIAKFEMLVENRWSESISGAYAEMFVYNTEGAVMANFKSAAYDISPLSKQIMVSFWDTEGVGEGSYDSSVVLNYGSKSAQEDFKLEVSDNEIRVIGVGYVISNGDSVGGGSGLVMILIVVVAVLVIVNLLWFLRFRKKLGK